MIKYLFILFILLVSCKQVPKAQYSFQDIDTLEICIPVRIGGITYDFVFDTGSPRSLIRQGVFEKHNFLIEDSVIMLRQKIFSCYYQSNEWMYRIGGVYGDTKFYCSEDSPNLIGMDIIGKYYWKFDRSTHTFQVQDTPISIEQNSADIVYKMNYYLNSNGTPIVDISVNDSISIPLAFDTGFSGLVGFKYEGNDIHGNIPLMIKLEHYDQLNDNGFLRYIYNLYGYNALIPYKPSLFYLLLDSIRFNNLPPLDFVMQIDSDPIHGKTYQGYVGLLSVSMVRQFRTFYIDPVKKEFTFCVSPADSNLVAQPRKSDVMRLKSIFKKRVYIRSEAK